MRPFNVPGDLPNAYTDKLLNECCLFFNSKIFITAPEIRINEDKALGQHFTKENEVEYKALKNITNKKNYKDNEKKEAVIPEGGWVCLVCQNYNFYGRTKCNRCGKVKTKDDPIGKPKYLSKKSTDENIPPFLSLRKKLKEQEGNWRCQLCKNINYAFRRQCNRCRQDKGFIRTGLNKQAQPYISPIQKQAIVQSNL